MTPPEAGPPPEETLSRDARAFLERPLFSGALWLGGGLLTLILLAMLATFFLESGPGSGISMARAIFQMFLRR